MCVRARALGRGGLSCARARARATPPCSPHCCIVLRPGLLHFGCHCLRRAARGCHACARARARARACCATPRLRRLPSAWHGAWGAPPRPAICAA